MTITEELAGVGEQGPLRSTGWSVPGEIAIVGSELLWHRNAVDSRVHAVPTLLDQFRRLHSSDDDRLLHFARRFGPLSTAGTIEDSFRREGRESIQLWRDLSREVDDLLAVAALLHSGAEVTAEHWTAFVTVDVRQDGRLLDVSFSSYGPLEFLSTDALVDARQLVSLYLSAWLEPVSIIFGWSNTNRSAMYLAAGSLVGGLGLQIAQRVSRSGGIALSCVGCASSFSPTHGNQRYCRTCRETKEPERLAALAHRRRTRARAASGLETSVS